MASGLYPVAGKPETVNTKPNIEMISLKVKWISVLVPLLGGKVVRSTKRFSLRIIRIYCKRH